jgi:hypothetical protein
VAARRSAVSLFTRNMVRRTETGTTTPPSSTTCHPARRSLPSDSDRATTPLQASACA